MVVAGILTIVFFLLVPISIAVGFFTGINKDDEDIFVISFLIAWVFGVLGSISLIAFAILAVMQALN